MSRTIHLLLAAIVALLAVIALRPLLEPALVTRAETRFEYVQVLSTNWMRNGRNGNVWHMATQTDRGPGLGDPQFIVRVPFEKLDQAPAGQQ